MKRTVDGPLKSVTLARAGSNDAVNLQLYRRLVSLIVAGHWADGARLPSSRKLAADTGVSRTTAALALDRLVCDGWAVSRPRSGLFVAPATIRPAVSMTARDRASGSPPVPFELSQGAVDCFPHARWAKLQSRVWAAHVPGALYDPDVAGDFGLRSSLVRHLLVTRGVRCTPEELFLVPSTRAALALAARILASDGVLAAFEDPGYPHALDSARSAGLETLPVPLDREGIRPDCLAASGRPTLAYVTPAAQFPTGAVMSAERREAVAQWCVDGGHWLFEDDYDWDARFDGARPPPPLKAGPAGERTFYCQSLSRTLFSSFRLSVLVAPEPLRQRAIAAQDGIEGASNLPSQLVLKEFIDRGEYAAHLRKLRSVYRERREALLELVAPFLGTAFERAVNPAGLRLVLRCGPRQAERFAARLRDEGILCSTLGELSAGGTRDDGIVLGFAAFSPEEIRGCADQVERALSG